TPTPSTPTPSTPTPSTPMPSATLTPAPTGTLAPTPPPPAPVVATFCGPRPDVRVFTVPVSSGQLQATIAAQSSPAAPNNSLNSFRVTGLNNATATINGSLVSADQVVNLPPGTQQVTLLVKRQATGQASVVSFVVVDVCGVWSSFVGGGPDSF